MRVFKYMVIVFSFIVGQMFLAATMVAPESCTTPDWLKDLVPGITKCTCIDFTGDGIKDYIVLAEYTRTVKDVGEVPLGDEWWITSEQKIILKKTVWASDYKYLWFANLDSDPVPEIISAYGFSEDIDYTIQKLDLITGSFKVLFYFEPVLVEPDGTYYHGYPWDVTDIKRKIKGKKINLLVQVRQRGPREGRDEFTDNQGMPDYQHKVPMIFFFGKSTQPDLAKFDPLKPKWIKLEDIEKLANNAALKASAKK
jgi:hypothetical protein